MVPQWFHGSDWHSGQYSKNVIRVAKLSDLTVPDLPGGDNP